MMEIWVGVPGWPGYLVSDRGRVRGKRSKHVLKPCADAQGYQCVQLRRGGRTYMRRVHRLVLRAFRGECPRGQESCHNDGEPSNNELSNLRWDSHRNNMADAFLSEEEVVWAREEVWRGASYRSIAGLLGVSGGTVSALCRGLSYLQFGGPLTDRVQVKENAHRYVRYLYDMGLNFSEIARETGFSERHVRRLTAR